MISTALFDLPLPPLCPSDFLTSASRLPTGDAEKTEAARKTQLLHSYAFGEVERLIAVDPGRRGIRGMVRPGELMLASHRLVQADSAVLVTGFYIPAAQNCETDGPPGALALGRALSLLGKEASYLTDEFCHPTLLQAKLDPLRSPTVPALSASEKHLLVSIERVGRAADRAYYNMRGEDISPYTGELDHLFLNPDNAPWTIGVGDGGNEIGMGRVREEVRGQVRHGERIGSVVSTAQLVVAGTSNWGAWGLVAGLSILSGRDLLPSNELAWHDLARMVEAGAVDGGGWRSGWGYQTSGGYGGRPPMVHSPEYAEFSSPAGQLVLEAPPHPLKVVSLLFQTDCLAVSRQGLGPTA